MILRALLLACFVLVACEKADGPRSSGTLTATETALFKRLPRGAVFVFGGNYMKLSSFMQSAMGPMFAAMGEGMKEWMACFADLKDIKLAGTVTFADGGAEMRMVMTGATLDQLQGCADRANLPATKDADGKYLVTRTPAAGATTTEQGYLVLDDGMLYTRSAMSLLAGVSVTPASRAELEGDIAKLAAGTAADDTRLLALAAKVDRSRTMWFAGIGEGTPLAGKVGEIYGSVDIAPGAVVDVTAQIVDAGLATQIVDGVAQMKKSAAQAPAALRAIAEQITVTRSGDRIRGTLKLSEAQVADLMKQAAAVMPQ